VINEDVRHIVEAELVEGERLLWADKPSKFPIEWLDVFTLAFYLYFLGLTYVSLENFIEIAREILPVYGKYLPLLWVAYVCFLACRVVLRMLRRNWSVYGVTNGRIFIKSNLLWSQVESLDNVKDVNRTGDNTLATIVFFPIGYTSLFDRLSEVYRYGRRRTWFPKFYNVPNVERLETLINEFFINPKPTPRPDAETARLIRRRRRLRR